MINRFVASIRRMFMDAWLRIPFGDICSLQDGSTSIRLTKQFMVIVCDGQTQDALPIYLVGTAMVCKIALRMDSMGYTVNLNELPQDELARVRSLPQWALSR